MSVLNHVDIVTNDILEELLAQHNSPCLSLFMPTVRMGPEVQQNPIRLKNLLKEAEEQLTAIGSAPAVQRELLAPIQALDDHVFWQQQSDGLAVFAAEKQVLSYRVPLALEELVVVGSRFYIKPLLPLLSHKQRFYVLALSINQVRLFQATQHSISEIPLANTATSLAEALQFDDPEKETQFHTSTGAPASTDARAASFHGHAADEDRKSDILRFFRQVTQGVNDVLGEENAPLVLVGVDYLHPLYRQANTYAHLVNEGVEGNPDGFGLDELHAQTWDIVKARLDAERAEVKARFKTLLASGSSQASANLKTVVPAAFYGRVDTLFVARGRQMWGEFDQQAGTVRLYDEATSDNADLLDLAAAQTILKDGAVYVVAPDEMPAETPIAAIFRY
ncbi:MAG: hypothetical protein GYB65_19875 [Chloroflexi bacterium]|nr:hypothetical protein [Chloroflexota bacterium]